MRSILCAVLTFTLSSIAPAQENVYSIVPESANMTIMTWNILAPIWVDRNILEKDGIDLNLLDEDNRVLVVIREIMRRKPDVLALQEVQESVFEKLTASLRRLYTPVAFAPNIKDYWKSYVTEGMQYVPNGVATFIRRRTVGIVSKNTFETSSNGSIALTSVLYPKLPAFSRRRPMRREAPFIVINAHHESGFTQADSDARLAQGTVIMREADRVQAALSQTQSNVKPFVVIAGDFNSQFPFPGFMNYKNSGYLDALETAGDPTQQTYFYATPKPLPTPTGNIFVTGATLDHIMFKMSDVADNRVAPVSAVVPDISSDDLTEDSYVKILTNVITSELSRGNLDESFRILSILLKISNDNQDYGTEVNRALRLGSDHLPLIVNILYAV